MEIEISKITSKGQVVIPQEIREELSLKEGMPFAVTAQGDSILLKRIEIKSGKSGRSLFGLGSCDRWKFRTSHKPHPSTLTRAGICRFAPNDFRRATTIANPR